MRIERPARGSSKAFPGLFGTCMALACSATARPAPGQIAVAYELVDLGVTNTESTYAGAGPVINDLGVVAYGNPAGLAVWHDGVLGYVPGSDDGSFALDINNRGDIVGRSREGTELAWIDGEAVDLGAVVPFRQ